MFSEFLMLLGRKFSGFQDLIVDLNIFSEFLMLLGRISHIFGPRKDIFTEP